MNPSIGVHHDFLGGGGVRVSLLDGDNTGGDGAQGSLLVGGGVRVSPREGDVPDTGGGGNVVGGVFDNGHMDPGKEVHQDHMEGDGVRVGTGSGGNVISYYMGLESKSGCGGKIGDGHYKPGGEEQVDLLSGGDGQKPGGGDGLQGKEEVKMENYGRFSWTARVAVIMAFLMGILVSTGENRPRLVMVDNDKRLYRVALDDPGGWHDTGQGSWMDS